MVKIKARKPQRERAFGTIALIEDKNGKLEMRCDIIETDGVPDSVMDRIKAAVAGLAYMYETQTEEVDRLGGAYLNGLETGITITKQMQKTAAKDGEPKAGFHAKI